MATFEELANPWVAALGVYEPGKPLEEVARELGFRSADEIVKLASNENALGPSPLAMQAMHDAVASMHRYPDGGAFHLKQKLAGLLGVAPDQLLFGNGSNELLEFIGHVFLGPRTNAVVAECSFVVYRLIAAASRAAVKEVPMRAFAHDLPAMAAAVDARTRVVFVGNPNNPTSTAVAPEAVERFMQAVSPDVIVCFDEAYLELLPPERRPDTLRYVREGRPVIVLRTFSKIYGLAGLRLGYAVAPAACIRLFDRVRQPFNVNAMAQAAALAALDDNAYVARTRAMVRAGLAYLEREFARLGLEVVPGAANFMLVRVGNGREVFQKLQAEGVIVRPMDPYRLPEYVRVTVGTRAENEKLIQATARVLGR